MLPELEAKIQAKIIKQLEEDGWIVLKSIANNKSGYPDLQCLKQGRCVFIEVKRPGGSLKPLQEFRHRQLRAHGFEVHVMNTANAVEILNSKQASLSES